MVKISTRKFIRWFDMARREGAAVTESHSEKGLVRVSVARVNGKKIGEFRAHHFHGGSGWVKVSA